MRIIIIIIVGLILLKFDFDLQQPSFPPPMMQQPQVPFIPGPLQDQAPPLPPKQPSPVPVPRGVAGGNLPPGTPPTTALRDHGIKVSKCSCSDRL